MSVAVPVATAWTDADTEEVRQLLAELDDMATLDGGAFNNTSVLLHEALAEVCNPRITPDSERGAYWRPYRDCEVSLRAFFSAWMTYAPSPINPGEYIEHWDHLVNTDAGLHLNNDDERFKAWFVRFLNLRGRWLNSTASTGSIDAWLAYEGTPEHPFDIGDFVVPEGGFQSFNQFFLRQLQDGQRPMCDAADDPRVVVSPCDGGVFFLTRGEELGGTYALPGKSGDTFELKEAVPGFGGSFLGGPLLDILLWFTDYHHFHAPVSGTLIHQGVYEGSYNYDFDNFDPNDPYAPKPPADSDRAGWYANLGKHKRYVWVFRTEELGLVAMIAIGFWGVGSIINEVPEGATLRKGDYMGHFGYGGSSIVLAFEPGLDLEFVVGGRAVGDADHPTLMKVHQGLARSFVR